MMEAQRWIERFELVCIYVSSLTKKNPMKPSDFFQQNNVHDRLDWI